MKATQKNSRENAYAYYRYSSHNQDDGNSIAAQQEGVRQWAKEHNVKIVKEYMDKAKTGTTSNRNGYQEMIDDINKDSSIKYVLVHQLDRMFRNTREQLNVIYNLKMHNIGVIITNSGLNSLVEDDMDKIIDDACQAEKYALRLSKETRKGLKVNADKALHNGGAVPYGFKLNAEKKLEIDELKSPAVEGIFKKYAAGMSYNDIIKWLDESGYKNVNGGKFQKSTLRAMLENEKYCGTYFWDKTASKDFRRKRNSHKKKDEYVRIENGCPAIVSKELFDKVQQRLTDNANKIKNHNGKNYYPMNGKIFCKHCGQELRGFVQYSGSSKNNKPVKQYKAKCDCQEIKSVNQKYIDDMIMFGLRECIFSSVNTYELLNRLNEYTKNENKDNDLQIDVLTEQRNDLQRALKNLIGFIKKGNASEAITSEIQDVESQIRAIDERLEQLITAKKRFIADDLLAIKKAFVPYMTEVCNEDTLTMIDDVIKKVEVDDVIKVKLNPVIRVSRDTKGNFN